MQMRRESLEMITYLTRRQSATEAADIKCNSGMQNSCVIEDRLKEKDKSRGDLMIYVV